jgi:ribosomal protein S18 acetylase RimI-like enzyme
LKPADLHQVTLRRANELDRPFVRRLYATTRETEIATLPWTEEQKSAFVSQQFDAQWTHYNLHYGSGNHDIVEVNGVPAGRFFVDRREDEILIVDITIAPEFRSLGLGAQLISMLQQEAASSNKRLLGHVECHNRACSFWRRMGFGFTTTDGVYYEIVWRA